MWIRAAQLAGADGLYQLHRRHWVRSFSFFSYSITVYIFAAMVRRSSFVRSILRRRLHRSFLAIVLLPAVVSHDWTHCGPLNSLLRMNQL